MRFYLIYKRKNRAIVVAKVKSCTFNLFFNNFAAIVFCFHLIIVFKIRKVIFNPSFVTFLVFVLFCTTLIINSNIQQIDELAFVFPQHKNGLNPGQRRYTTRFQILLSNFWARLSNKMTVCIRKVDDNDSRRNKFEA